MDERVRQAGLLYEQAVHAGDSGPLTQAARGLDGAEADLSLARGQVLHGRFLLGRDQDQAGADPAELALFEQARALYRELGDLRGEAAALFWLACWHQVVKGDDVTALPLLERSLVLATGAGDTEVMAEALRHLGIAAHRAGQLGAARQRLEESTRLRRADGLPVAAAANLVGLAYIAAAEHRGDDAAALLDEAAVLAGASSARRVLDQVTEARAAITD